MQVKRGVPSGSRLAILLLWVAFIWGHSLVPGPASSAESDAAAGLLSPLLAALGAHDAHAMTFLVRKGAHFLEYLVLGALAWTTLCPARGTAGQRAAALVTCMVVPCIDEGIQLIVPGRDGRLSDVLLDLCGCIVGLALARALRRVRSG